MRAIERLSGVDRAWLLMDKPTNPMIVVGLLVLQSVLDRAQLRDLVASRFLGFERFRSMPISDPLGARWIPATHFDLDDHILPVALPLNAGQHELERLVGELASTPFGAGRPPWTFHLVERYLDGSAIIVRLHHCYADGVALIHVLLSLADGESAKNEGSVPPRIMVAATPASESRSLISSAIDLVPGVLAQTLHEGADLIAKGIHYLLHPREGATLAANTLEWASELAHLGSLPDDPPTRLKQPLSGVRRAAWGQPLSLDEVKTIGKTLGCTVNDVLISTLAGSLGRYLESQGTGVTGQTIRAVVPVNLRPSDAPSHELGNRFGLVFVDLPIGIRHPLERLYAVHMAMQALKGSSQARVTLVLLALIGSLPMGSEEAVTAFLSTKASLVASNLAGPRGPLYLAGVPLSQILFWVPQGGSIGTGVSMLSYNGQVQYGVIADRQLIPHPRELMSLIGAEFERLVMLVLLGGVALADSDQ